MGKELDMFLFGAFWLILFGLIARDWNGANSALKTTVSGADVIIRDLQMR